QEAALAQIADRLGGGFSAMLLHGVTGSGKTEVYIRAIRRVIETGRQAILLVPEIGLATQTIQRLLKRLPRVAVLHSALTGAQRAFYYEQIRQGRASVVVGPRSAVFAPVRKLGLIVVDEEHDSSYKQDTVPRYNARDVAVMRASLSGVAVLLGSATPSLESLHNVELNRYSLLRLPHRVRSLPMPTLEVVNLRREMTPGRVELIGATLTNKMAAALDRREQIILLMNRRGYASYVFCPSCKWEMTCKRCTRTMVFHQATRMVICHYCRHREDLPEYCPVCKGKLLLFGMGIQRIETELARKFPSAKAARIDSDSMTSSAQFRKVFEDFRDGELDILLGTQMVAKGLDFPRVSLVGVISADTSLSIPDFRASERTFQLIVQVAGRAGRADLPGQVVVQTLHEDEPAIHFAARHDYEGFSTGELALRRRANCPPFTRMVRFIIRHRDVCKAQQGARELAGTLRELLPMDEIIMYGPQQAGVAKIRDHFRFEIQLFSHRPGEIQRILWPKMASISRANAAEVLADADPSNLL
ncbi:MAG: primosomal protein N', partial [Planctomycetes bacterium]|nr:primosomal protein N' [Planctomycetota bacterium]